MTPTRPNSPHQSWVPAYDFSGGIAALQSLLNPGIRAVLVKGEPGTGKTILAFELLRLYGRGIYVSTRMPEEKTLEQYPGAKALFKQGKLLVAKPKTVGARFEDVRLGTAAFVMESVLESISRLREPLVILDSWDTVAKELEYVERMKTEKALLALADAKKARFAFISEEPALTTTDYLVDAIVVLKDEFFEGRRVRRIERRKLRGSDISQESSLFSLFDARFTVFQPENVSWLYDEYEAKPFQPINNTTGYYSTGSKDLDALTSGGLEKGTRLLLELGRRIGSNWHLPLLVSISCNFIANGGCCINLPSAALTPETVKEGRLRHLPKQTVESSYRVAHFGETPTEDPCFFQLDPTSPSKSFETFWNVTGQITKVGEGRRPCLAILGVDKVEMVFGGEDITALFSRGAVLTRYHGDAAIFIVKYSTKSKEFLADLADIHLKLDEIDGALVLYSLKPPSRIYHVEYDYSRGYPYVKLMPVT